eukprot:XP_011676159.1 PREDICTED: neuropilin-1a-like [Strongylocentrotus purpuratus]
MASFIILLLLCVLVTPPSFGVTENLLFSCDFGTSTSETFCGMVQGVDDDFDWKLTSTSGKADTGPSQDHTGKPGGGGRFLWTDTDGIGGGGGQKATIATPPFNLTGDEGWLTFWYHLYGDGKLEVSVCQDGETVLILSGDQGNEWHEQNTTVSCGDNPVQITFTSTRSSTLSDVGVDDLYLYHHLPSKDNYWISVNTTFFKNDEVFLSCYITTYCYVILYRYIIA